MCVQGSQKCSGQKKLLDADPSDGIPRRAVSPTLHDATPLASMVCIRHTHTKRPTASP